MESKDVIKSVLGAIPTYFMSLYRALEAVLKHIERMRNSFFLGAELEERKITWVSWKTVMAEKQFGGLGISSLFALNNALLFKWIWRFLTRPSDLWTHVIRNIYGTNGGIFLLITAIISEPLGVIFCSRFLVSTIKVLTFFLYVLVSWVMVCQLVFRRIHGAEIPHSKHNFLVSIIWK